MGQLRSKILGNVGANWLGLLTDSVTGFLLTPFILHALGATAFGIWVLLSAFSGYYGLLDFGMRNAVIRYVARHRATEDYESLNAIVSSTLFTYSLAGAAVLVLSLIIGWQIERIFVLPTEWIRPARILMYMFGVGTALGFPLSVYGGLLEGLQEFRWTGGIQSITSILRAGLIVWTLRSGMGLLTVGVITLGTNLLVSLVFVVVSHALLPQLKLTVAKIQWQTIGKLSSFGLVTFWIGVAQRLRFQSDAVVIGMFMSMQAVNLFAIGSRLVIYSTQFVTNMTQVFTPVSSHFDALGSHERLQKMMIQGNFFSSLIAFPVCAFLVLAGKSIIRVWVGSSYLESYTVLLILAVPVSLFTAQSATIAVLYGTAKHTTLAKVLLAEGIANLVLSIILLQKYGIEGVALGTAIPLSFTTFFFLPLHICRQLDVSLRKYLLEAHVYPALLCLPFALAVWALNTYWPAQNYLVLGLQLCLGGLVYLAAAAAFSMSSAGSVLRLVSVGRMKGSAA